MRRGLGLLVVLVTLLSLPGLASAQPKGNLRYTITVAKFENKAQWSGRFNLGDAWGAVLTDLLQQSGRFVVLGEKDMRQEALNEQDFARSGRVAGGKKAPATGRMTPAQLIVKGVITHVESERSGTGAGIRVAGIRVGGDSGSAEINVTIYVVDSTTGQVVASTDVVGSSKRLGLALGYSGHGFSGDVDTFNKDNVGKAVQDACDQAVKFVVAQLPKMKWTATVVMVKGDQVYINRGSREGVAPGQELVVGKEEVIADPDTGEILDRDMTDVARVKVQTAKEKLSIATVISGDAAAIEKGLDVHLP